MKLIISNNVLKKALKKIGTVVPKKAIISALENIIVTAEGNQLTIKATDLEVTILYQLTLNDNASKNDTSLINFHWLKGISDLHGDEPIYIEALKSYTSITASSGEYRQDASAKLKDFPPLHLIPTTENVTMIPGFVKWLNSASIFMDAKNEFERWKSSVYLEIINNHLILTATNARQLFSHTFDIESSLNRSLMISRTVVNALDGFVDTQLFLDGDSFAFTAEGVTIISKIPEGKFPDYNKVIPKDVTANCSVNREVFKAMLEKIKFINPDYVKIIPIVDSFTLEVKNEKGQTANLSVPFINPYQGETMEVAVSPSGLHQLLTQTDYENIGLAFKSYSKAVMLSNTTDLSYIALIMPMKN